MHHLRKLDRITTVSDKEIFIYVSLSLLDMFPELVKQFKNNINEYDFTKDTIVSIVRVSEGPTDKKRIENSLYTTVKGVIHKLVGLVELKPDILLGNKSYNYSTLTYPYTINGRRYFSNSTRLFMHKNNGFNNNSNKDNLPQDGGTPQPINQSSTATTPPSSLAKKVFLFLTRIIISMVVVITSRSLFIC